MPPQTYELSLISTIAVAFVGVIIFIVVLNTTYMMGQWVFRGGRWFIRYVNSRGRNKKRVVTVCTPEEQHQNENVEEVNSNTAVAAKGTGDSTVQNEPDKPKEE